MGVYLRWKQATGASYNLTYIYRAGSSVGPFSEIAHQSYNEMAYYDIDGTASHYYKIRFYDNLAAKWSDFSDAFQGGTFKGYCAIDDVRNLTNLSTTDISDAQICQLIQYAGQQINQMISVYVEEELIEYIDEVKTNNIDGTNTSFYTWYYPIGDFNNTFKADISDITVYEIDSSTDPATKTVLTVTSITPNTGKFVLATAPTSDKKLLVTYRYTQESVSDPHPLVRQACIFLTAALAYQKINVGKSPKFKIGNVNLQRDMDSFKVYYTRFRETLSMINDRSMADIKPAPSMPGTGDYEINYTPEERSKTT
jgi:hypothetical protein